MDFFPLTLRDLAFFAAGAVSLVAVCFAAAYAFCAALKGG